MPCFCSGCFSSPPPPQLVLWIVGVRIWARLDLTCRLAACFFALFCFYEGLQPIFGSSVYFNVLLLFVHSKDSAHCYWQYLLGLSLLVCYYWSSSIVSDQKLSSWHLYDIISYPVIGLNCLHVNIESLNHDDQCCNDESACHMTCTTNTPGVFLICSCPF